MGRKFRARDIEDLRQRLGNRSIVLVGLMGAGKTSIGRRLAARLGLPFADADSEIEAAAGKSIPEIFADHGEAYFRDGERRVIARLLQSGPQVLATGGGAFIDAATRASIAANGISLWLRADLDLLMKRVRRRNNRPLLQTADPEGTLKALLESRYPVYGTADIVIDSKDVPHASMVAMAMTGLMTHFGLDAGEERRQEACDAR